MMVLIYIYIYIYIMMAHNIKILFLLREIFNDKYWWVTSYEFVERVIYLKGLFPHPNVSEFYLLSYLTPPLFPFTDTLEGFLE